MSVENQNELLLALERRDYESILGTNANALLTWDEYDSMLAPIAPNASRRLFSGESSGGDAYRLMVELYALYAQPPELIPYVLNGEISEEAIVPRR